LRSHECLYHSPVPKALWDEGAPYFEAEEIKEGLNVLIPGIDYGAVSPLTNNRPLLFQDLNELGARRGTFQVGLNLEGGNEKPDCQDGSNARITIDLCSK
jgi:hypothetical protein